MTERTDWTFLGRKIGSATGWDGDLENFVLYEFIPCAELRDKGLRDGDLQIDIAKGLFMYYSDDGGLSYYTDIINTLQHVPIAD